MKPTVHKDTLLAILRENRSKHRTVFEAAVEGFRAEAERRLAAEIERIRTGRPRRVRVYLEEPQDHTRDYDRAIKMVELHSRDFIELTEEDAARYIQDDWDWKRAWLSTSNTYAAAVTTKAYGEQEE